ncbi:hypothetical protein PR048_027541 [Dryococelus australis]|uniref:Uncharacterized protein n=1 Tax=Dryococelus australis TaxID=614101 RepID=A0ABQ9GGU1_9NEOP|nr:hypothetical protein PR048_027541 [Dryococelus australis]
MPLAGGFSRGSPVLISIALIGSQDHDVKSRPNLFTHIFYYRAYISSLEIDTCVVVATVVLSLRVFFSDGGWTRNHPHPSSSPPPDVKTAWSLGGRDRRCLVRIKGVGEKRGAGLGEGVSRGGRGRRYRRSVQRDERDRQSLGSCAGGDQATPFGGGEAALPQRGGRQPGTTGGECVYV